MDPGRGVPQPLTSSMICEECLEGTGILLIEESAGVQLQQSGIQPEEVNGLGERNGTASQFSFGLPVYFKLMILFYSFTKALGQRFDIFSSH